MVKISVCIGSACHLKGSYNVINGFQQAIEKNGVSDKVEISGTFCLGHCGEDVSIQVDGEYFSVKPEEINKFFNEKIMSKIN
ncbi:MAG: (2Fe-2S) ferredoxin domain-containing protein [Lachnospirales bacterium]